MVGKQLIGITWRDPHFNFGIMRMPKMAGTGVRHIRPAPSRIFHGPFSPIANSDGSGGRQEILHDASREPLSVCIPCES